MVHFPALLRALPKFDGPFDAFKLAAANCDVLFASYPAGTTIPPHQHDTENVGVITEGELILTLGGKESRYGPGQWYHVPARAVHAARFDRATSEIEFWFHAAANTVGSPRLDRIAPVFRVTDLNRSLSFYRDRLGFELEFCYEDFYASVRRDGCHLHIQCAPRAPRDQVEFERKEHLDACIMVRDAEALSRSFAAAGVAFSVPLRQMPYGTEFYVRDPDGYILGFVQPAE